MRRRCARFRVVGRNFDGATAATVEIEPTGADDALIHVRPKHRKRVYTMPLSWVASVTIWHVVKSEVGETQRRRRRR